MSATSDLIQNILNVKQSPEITVLVGKLLEAVKEKNLRKVREMHEALEKAGGDINASTFSQQTVIHIACYKDYYDHHVLVYLMNTAKNVDLHLQDGLGWTPVHYAAYSECEGALNDLLEHAKKIGASNIGFTDATAKMTKAHMSADKWKLHGQDLSCQTPKGLAENAGKPAGVELMGKVLVQLADLIQKEKKEKDEKNKLAESRIMLTQYTVRNSAISSSQLQDDSKLVATTAGKRPAGSSSVPTL